MKIHIHNRGLPGRIDPRRIAARVRTALGALSERIARLTVTIEDVNGPERGGADKRCRLRATLRTGARVVRGEHLDPEISVALDRAALRLERQVARAAGRRHHRRPLELL